MSFFEDEKKLNELEEQKEEVRQKETEETFSRTQAANNQPKVNSTPSKKGYFFSGFIGVIIGSLLSYSVLTQFLPVESSVQEGVEEKKQVVASDKVSYEVVTDNQVAIEKALETVVGITNYQTYNTFWRSEESLIQEAGSGSGVIYKVENGLAYIITNYHVIENATSLDVTLADGSKKEATVVGSDVWTDLAVITVEAQEGIKVTEFGDSDVLRIGEPVIAIGNPLGLEFYGSVTQGIVSGLNRAVAVDINNDGQEDWNANVLQTDAAINPGNSGGALINIKGQLIGINSMKIATQEVEGIGFAIPINEAQEIINDLEKYGEVKRPYMGVSLVSVSDVSAYHQVNTLKLPKEVISGVVLDTVEENSPAAKAGLKRLDTIVTLDGKEINDVLELRKHLYTEKEIGQSMKIGYYRDGQLLETTMVLTSSME